MNGHLVFVRVVVGFCFSLSLFSALLIFIFQINLLSSSHDTRQTEKESARSRKEMRNVVIYWLTIIFLLA